MLEWCRFANHITKAKEEVLYMILVGAPGCPGAFLFKAKRVQLAHVLCRSFNGRLFAICHSASFSMGTFRNPASHFISGLLLKHLPWD